VFQFRHRSYSPAQLVQHTNRQHLHAFVAVRGKPNASAAVFDHEGLQNRGDGHVGQLTVGGTHICTDEFLRPGHVFQILRLRSDQVSVSRTQSPAYWARASIVVAFTTPPVIESTHGTGVTRYYQFLFSFTTLTRDKYDFSTVRN